MLKKKQQKKTNGCHKNECSGCFPIIQGILTTHHIKSIFPCFI